MGEAERQGMTDEHLLNDPEGLQSRIRERLSAGCGCQSLFTPDSCDRVRSSSVMLLLGLQEAEDGAVGEISIILNKRSRDVLQGGDLCCPGAPSTRGSMPASPKPSTCPGPLFPAGLTGPA